jgi:hypothetical protein
MGVIMEKLARMKEVVRLLDLFSPVELTTLDKSVDLLRECGCTDESIFCIAYGQLLNPAYVIRKYPNSLAEMFGGDVSASISAICPEKQKSNSEYIAKICTLDPNLILVVLIRYFLMYQICSDCRTQCHDITDYIRGESELKIALIKHGITFNTDTVTMIKHTIDFFLNRSIKE